MCVRLFCQDVGVSHDMCVFNVCICGCGGGGCPQCSSCMWRACVNEFVWYELWKRFIPNTYAHTLSQWRCKKTTLHNVGSRKSVCVCVSFVKMGACPKNNNKNIKIYYYYLI
eukprot:GHVR01190783.1.p1 GENE.GHVR01190783.1~~GHVR01190783.1.p1  ORF type:complete len:112 (+),score=30.73 GHVR01190783.1:250-585(+)